MSGGNIYQQPGGYPPNPDGSAQPGASPPPNAYPQPPGGYQQPGQYAPQPSPYPPQGYAQPYGQGPQPGQYTYSYVQPAALPTEAFGGFWIRVVAYIIDTLVVGIPLQVVNFAVQLLVGGGVQSTSSFDSSQPAVAGAALGVMLALNAFNLIVVVAYFTFMETNKGGTLGKLAVGLRVVSEDGVYLSIGQAIGRYFAKFLSGCALLIGFIMVGFHEKKRALHDLIVGTYVVRKEYVNPSQLQQR